MGPGARHGFGRGFGQAQAFVTTGGNVALNLRANETDQVKQRRALILTKDAVNILPGTGLRQDNDGVLHVLPTDRAMRWMGL